MKTATKMASLAESCILDDQALLADLFTEVPEDCVELFRRAKLGIGELLTLSEVDFILNVSVNSPPIEVTEIWRWIINWRNRNVSIIFYIPNQETEQETSSNSTDGDETVIAGGSKEQQLCSSIKLEDTDMIEEVSRIQPNVNASASPAFLTPNHLRALLEKTDHGKRVLQTATTHTLSDAGRKLVVDTVARFHLLLGRKTTAETISELGNVIVRVFPKESKDTYYIPKAGRSNPAGKLFSRINYIKQSERKKLKTEDDHITGAGEEKAALQDLPAEVIAAEQWLAINVAPWQTVLHLWEVSYPARKRLLKQFRQAQHLIASYPQFREEFGYQLVSTPKITYRYSN
nr:uncharacterized protein LOC115259737 [Aedes albopictus]